MTYRKSFRAVHGFTLTELILVVAIIAILSAMTVPKAFDLIKDISEKAVAERLVEDLNYIRNYAVSRHTTTWLVVDVAQNQYGLYTGPTAGTRVLLPDLQTGATAVLDLDIEYNDVLISSANFGGATEFSFNWWGVPSSGGTIELNSNRTVTLVAETGMAYETP